VADSAFFLALKVAEVSFTLDFGDEYAIAGSGAIRNKQRRPDLWRASFVLANMTHDVGRAVHASAIRVRGRRDTFYGFDSAAKFPRFHPTGSGLGSPQINSLNADGQRLSLKGMVAGAKVARGDFLAFGYGSPVRRALHQIVDPDSTTADGSGVTADFYVQPAIRPGASVNTAVILVRAAAEMMIVGEMDFRSLRRKSTLSFEALQVI
jgi:hypothetical protein